MEEVEEKPVEEMVEVSEPEMPIMPLFGKWDLTEVNIIDTTLEKYINLDAFQVPHTGGRHSKKKFGKRGLTVIERFINNLMRRTCLPRLNVPIDESAADQPRLKRVLRTIFIWRCGGEATHQGA